MKRSGFTFIELILAIAIWSIIGIALFTSFAQIQKSAQNFDKISNLDKRALILQNLLERDINGIFVPSIGEEKKEAVPMQKAVAEKLKKEEAEKILEKVFFAVNENNILKELTFITCNPFQINLQSKPRIARVLYKLSENKNNKTFSLFRQESLSLEYSSIKKEFEYEVVDNVKSITVNYIIPGKKDYEILKDWKSNPKVIEKNSPAIPNFINVKIVLYDNERRELEQIYEFKYEVFAFASQFKQKKETRTPTTSNPTQGRQEGSS